MKGKRKSVSCVHVKLGKFHVVVVQQRQRNVQKKKKNAMHAQGCCFAKLNLLFFAVLVDVEVDVA